MKTIVFLYAGFGSGYAFEKCFDRKSSFDLSLAWAATVSRGNPVVVACDENNERNVKLAVSQFSGNVSLVLRKEWNLIDLLAAMGEQAKKAGADTIVYSFACKPFLDYDLTNSLLDYHFKYQAEYTNQDGYPDGFAPEVINCGTVNILHELASASYREEGLAKVKDSSIFDLMSHDLNQFEIETFVAHDDFRDLRLDFSCSSKGNLMGCKNLYELAFSRKIPLNAKCLSEEARKSWQVQHTVPAFYIVQICSNTAMNSVYNPYIVMFRNKNGKDPFDRENANVQMSLEQFRYVVSEIEKLSDTAVVSLGSRSEPMLAKDFVSYCAAVLEKKHLRLLVETSGLFVTEEIAAGLKNLDGSDRIDFILNVDAMTEDCFAKVNSLSLEEASIQFGAVKNGLDILEKHFPKQVYPQFTRMNLNEDQLESFYRFYKNENSPSKGKLIIQKYDSCCNLLPQEQPADLSPYTRNPCWHIKRDMVILVNGDVPLCKNSSLDGELGNIFQDGLELCWQKSAESVKNHIEKNYGKKCGDCDEYYTFNF